ncbi:hypothetical protein ES705_44652 [subsurface metagenome]
MRLPERSFRTRLVIYRGQFREQAGRIVFTKPAGVQVQDPVCNILSPAVGIPFFRPGQDIFPSFQEGKSAYDSLKNASIPYQPHEPNQSVLVRRISDLGGVFTPERIGADLCYPFFFFRLPDFARPAHPGVPIRSPAILSRKMPGQDRRVTIVLYRLPGIGRRGVLLDNSRLLIPNLCAQFAGQF